MANNEVIGNLVWIDLEMTGLSLETDVILDISSVITNGDLAIIAEGPSLAIHQPEAKLDGMDNWCKNHHTKNGLINDVRASNITVKEAELRTLEFIKQHCPKKTGIIAGNTIWQDRLFLQKYMPSIVDYLHYRVLDVTSVKILAQRWYPNSPYNKYKKNDIHRARSDVYESIAELKNYRTHFFVTQ